MIKFTNKCKLLLFILLLFSTSNLLATHYRAGEIVFRNISGLNYEIIVYTYTDQFGAGDPSTDGINVDFGDNTSLRVERTSFDILNPSTSYGVKRNAYKTNHTYKGAGVFVVSISDPNRVDAIRNINDGNSVNIPFSVQSQIIIDAGYTNQSPILLSVPIDRGCVGKVFVHNPSAYDPDGDSLVYEIRAPNIGPNMPVPGFTIPETSDSFTINQLTGQLTWGTPKYSGFYNIVIRIKEYRRNGVIQPILVGYVDRDIQIRILLCTNNPPIIASMSNACVIAGDLLEKNISAKDNDAGNQISLTGFGGPFAQKTSPAFTLPSTAVGNPAGFLFRWRPACTSIRADSFQAVFRAIDNGDPVPLTDVQSFKIKVNGPAPRNLTPVIQDNGFKLNWTVDTCGYAFGYRIYRRIDSSFWNPAYCQIGVPASTGFVLLDTVEGVNNNTYFDNDFGKGISPLINYCYRVTAFYLARNDVGGIVNLAEPSESKASIEVCALIQRTKPIITNVSVLKTNAATGAILVKWLKPLLLDSNQNPPPYIVQVKRAVVGTSNYVNVGTAKNYSTFAEIINDSLIDSNINTQSAQYYYKVSFVSGTTLVDESIIASSPFLEPYNTNQAVVLNLQYDVPWKNTSFVVYRQNGLNFDSIATTSSSSYIDTGLINGQTYCYYVKTVGNYNQQFWPDTLYNNSQVVCGTPVDTIPPCPPVLSYTTPCNKFNINDIILNWTYPANCKQDIQSYKVLYRKQVTDTWIELATLSGGANSYIDTRPQLTYGIAGCYAVIAIDTVGNVSSPDGNSFCIDNCPYYVLPNTFTPNTDNSNDIFKPFPYRFIEKIELQVYNRWGTPVFETTDIDINWDGKDQTSGKELVAGTYFYIIKIYENYLDGTKERKVRGTVEIIR